MDTIDEYLQRAKQQLAECGDNEGRKKMIYAIFPELKESEDERIRKEISKFLKEIHNANLETRRFIADRYGDAIPDDMIPTWLAWLEKQGSQNLANSAKTCKVEPKFKVGDWIVQQGVGIFKIIEIGKCGYEAIDCTGNRYSIAFLLENGCHLWSIQDAKDGDVLSFNDGHGNDSIELIKSITDKKIEFWFCLTNGNRYEVFDGITPYTNLVSREDATPATKEQCDQLEKAMADAGYRWNPDEKKMEKVEQNPAWSEKNEAILDALIRRFEGEDILVSPHLAVECLKTLKERYTWKPSDEQLRDLKLIASQNASNMLGNNLLNLYNDLQKL